MSNTTQYEPYKVKDLLLADWGRTEIKIAKAEMPGLMALHEEFGARILRTDQADLIGVKFEGPFESEHFKY